jgi:prepilin-type N-terminal cleavage/methylation domain-containing protein
MAKIKKTGNSGFTLVELLTVIAIIGILSALTMVGLGEMKNRANIAKAQHYIDQLDRAISQLSIETEVWPGGQPMGEVCLVNCADNEICADGCSFGLSAPEAGLTGTDGSYTGWTSPYIDEILLDPWGNEYFFDTDYVYDGNNVAVIGSYGPNGTGNNLYDGDDVIKILAK